MGQKLPYYMVYPTPFLFDDERKDERDYAYLKSMYPDMAKRILPYVEEECDRMEADCSMIYDEYPDKLQLRLMCGRICARVKEAETFPELMEEEPGEIQAEEAKIRRKPRPDHVREMTELLLFQELLRRRSCHRRNCPRVYWQ